MSTQCGRTGCRNQAHKRCAKCKVAYCDEHLVSSKIQTGIYRCPECDHYVRSITSGRVAEDRQAPR